MAKRYGEIRYKGYSIYPNPEGGYKIVSDARESPTRTVKTQKEAKDFINRATSFSLLLDLLRVD